MNTLHSRNFSSVKSLTFLVVLIISASMVGAFFYDLFKREVRNSVVSDKYSQCNVLGISIYGSLMTYAPSINEDRDQEYVESYTSSDDVVWSINNTDRNDNIRAIIIEVDSAGGEPVAAEEVANAIKRANKPVIAYIRQSGTSGAYWAISSADRIFASKNSDIGSIGVTASYVVNADENKKFIQLSSGKYKDIGHPYKLLTNEEKALAMRDVKITHQNFIEEVAKNRGLTIEEVTKISDGSSMMGDAAKSFGLIDEIGGYYEADQYVGTLIGDWVNVCWE